MTHPLIPEILEIASPLAANLGLEVVGAVLQTQKNPPVLRLDIRNLASDTSLDDCEKMSRCLEEALDHQEIIPGAYVLEISSPGISRQLTTPREFLAFKGFAVVIVTSPPYNGHQEWRGRLQKQDEASITINQKGRNVAIPREYVAQVQLDGSH
jgi:ribosome maturation factor RimP